MDTFEGKIIPDSWKSGKGPECERYINVKELGCSNITCNNCILYSQNKPIFYRWQESIKEPKYKYKVEANDTVVGEKYIDGFGDIVK